MRFCIVKTAATYPTVPKSELKHYIKFDKERAVFVWIEVYQHWDVRKGEVHPKFVPRDIALKAKARAATYPPYVEWSGIENALSSASIL